MSEEPKNHPLSAVWFNPDKPIEAYMPGVIAVLDDLARIAPEFATGGWSFGMHEITTPDSLTALIETKPVTSAYKPDGSPRLSTGFVISSPRPKLRTAGQRNIGMITMDYADDLPAQQSLNLVFQRITLPTVIELVRSIARHLHPDIIIAESDRFGDDLVRARTINVRNVRLIGQVSWIRDLSPSAVEGYPVTQVEEYAGGLFFVARSEHDGQSLAALNDQLERAHYPHHLGLLPQFHRNTER